MAPSSTKGAVTRLLRNAAINVTVFQFPCSTFWMSRSPCGARPYRRVIVVDTLVSSMNTSLLGSSLFCRRCNALRAAATSGRSCSAARDLFLRQSIFEFGQRDVRLLRYQLPHQILVRRQREIFVAAEFGRVDAARLPVKLEEADDRTDADPALLRGFRDRGPALDRLDHTPTQIRRIWLRHSCRPPPSRKLESYSRRYGNPRFSLSGKRSNERWQDKDCGRLTDLKWPKSYLRCRICGGGPWQKSDSKPVVVTFRTSPSIALQMSALKIIGRCVCCPQAPLMPTRPPVRHSTSKASCDATTI